MSFYALDVGFHQALTHALGLRRSAEILDGVRAHLERVRRMLMMPPGRIRQTLAEHSAISRRSRRATPKSARVAMERHLTETTGQFEIVRTRATRAVFGLTGPARTWIR